MLPLLENNKPAYILNVASTTAYQALPTLATYSTAKAFILSFSRAIRYELKNKNIFVTCLSPGSTRTDFVERSGMFHMKDLANKMGMNADNVAITGINAMFNTKAEVIPGFLNKLGAVLA